MNSDAWHPGCLTIPKEKVSRFEEKSKEEMQKLHQLKKEFEMERALESLRAFQTQIGSVPHGRNRLEWMYNGGPSDEDYLLGKKYKPSDTGSNNIKQLQNKPGSLFINKSLQKVNCVLEEEARLREDPMVTILREEQSLRKQIIKNPHKMKKLRDNAKLLKKLKKEAKKKRKRDTKKHKKKKKKRKTKNRSSSDDNDEPAVQTPYTVPNANPCVNQATAFKYGLIVATGGLQPTKSLSSSHSPSITRCRKPQSPRSLMRAKNISRFRSRQQKFQNENRNNHTGNIKKLSMMTKEEREQKLKQMMQDADTHDKRSRERLEKSMKRDIDEQKEFLKQHRDNAHNASFIKKMNKNLYMNSGETIESRIKKYKNSRQRGNTEHHDFLRR